MRQLLTLQESARTKPRKSPALHLLPHRSLSELDQSNLRQSKPRKQNLRGCVPVEGGQGRVAEVSAVSVGGPKDEEQPALPARLSAAPGA